MINLEEYLFLVDGPYASYYRPLLVTPKQAYQMKNEGWTILTVTQYKEECIQRGIITKGSKVNISIGYELMEEE